MASKWITPQNVPWQTQLNPAEEDAFRSWVELNRIPFDYQDPVADYDMRGFWKAQTAGDPRAIQAGNQHFPDTWKTPFHATFSNESQYRTPDAPSWQGDRLMSPSGKVVADETPKGLAKRASERLFPK
jgi:hypothetical protein